jgi:predicted phage terminase large subunit-like protein
MMIATVWTAGDPPLKALEAWKQSKANARYLNLAALNPEGKDSFLWDVREKEPRCYPAYEVLWPEYRDLAFIMSHKEEMLDEDFDCQFQGCTISKGATLAPEDCWGTYEQLPPLHFAVITCDTGLERGDRNDPSALLAIGKGVDGRVYVIDGDDGRWSQRELLMHTYLFYERIAQRFTRDLSEYNFYVPMLAIEKAAMGRPLFDAINDRNARGASFIPISLVDPVLTKVLRAREQSHKIQAGSVVLPRNWQYRTEFIKQWFRFPRWGSGHDEWVDLLSYGLKILPTEETVRGILRPNLGAGDMDEFERNLLGSLNGESMIGGDYHAAFKVKGDNGGKW